MDEIQAARKTRDEAFATFVSESAKATKSSLKAKAARKAYMLAADEVRFLERDALSYEPLIN